MLNFKLVLGKFEIDPLTEIVSLELLNYFQETTESGNLIFSDFPNILPQKIEAVDSYKNDFYKIKKAYH